jgi:hypothetical protein
MRYATAALAAALLVVTATLLFAPIAPEVVVAEVVVQVTSAPAAQHPAEECEEDGVWMFVDHHALDATEDSHGVSRACRSFDDLIDTAFEVAIQNGVLHYVGT